MANILIVDDDPAVQITIRPRLEGAGHHVTGAGDGRSGLALFETSRFELLFIDIFMPGMDGLETMRRVRAQQPAIPIIVISGRSVTPDAYAEPDFLKMATKLGGDSELAEIIPGRRTACGCRRLPGRGQAGGFRCQHRPPMMRTSVLFQARTGAAIRAPMRISA